MKHKFLLMVIFLLTIGNMVYAQKVTLDFRQEKLGKVMEAISKQTGKSFSYSRPVINPDEKVSISVKNEELYTALARIIETDNVEIEITDKKIFLKPVQKRTASTSTGERKSITGQVVDDTGEALIGVNVRLKGGTVGTATDVDGQFSINVPVGSALVISYLGYTPQEIVVGDKNNLDIVLQKDTQVLEEVVVVGYGTQKKVNLTGSVSAIKVDETLSSRSLTNVSTGLQGLLPGLSVVQNSGMAGKNDVSLLIRGLGTVNNASPLVVVDGMPDVDINRINMNDIESISILKDAASAAIYGSRAANGVILVTTKTGKGQKTAVNFSGSYGISAPTGQIEFMADYPRALTMHQRASSVNSLDRDQQFKNGTIDQWMALGMIDPLRYPNTDWWDWIMRDHGSVQNYTLSANANSDKSNFFISVGMMDEKGLQVNNDYTRYNARFNYDYALKHNMNVGIRFSGNWSKYTYVLPDGFTDGSNNVDLIHAIAGITPYDPVSGYYGGVMAYGEDSQAYNPYIDLALRPNKQNRQEALASMYYDWTLLKGLTARIDYSLNYYNQFAYKADMPARAYNFQVSAYGTRIYVGEDAGVSNTTNTGYKTQLNGRLNYNINIATHHDLSLMAAYSEEYWYNRSQSASRNNRIHPTLHEINAALTTVQSNGGSSNTEGLRSFIGRLNYSAYEKYLLEINFRADGSSRFVKGHQYGYFPSVAAGWRFTEEDFIKPLTGNWLYSGKIRASYGTLGNNSVVGLYEQKETLATNNYFIDSEAVKGFVNTKMINQSLSWETGSVTNAGLDLTFFKGKLSAELDYYNRFTSGMIRPSEMSIHLTGAYAAPKMNIGDMSNRGFEVNLTYRDKKGDFNYRVNANFSRNWTRLKKWNEFLNKGNVYVDMPYHFLYTYNDLGIAQTWQDIYNSAPQSLAPGDVLLLDVNGDGRISAEDRVAYPGYQRDRPTTEFALNASVAWKGFDLAMMLQGSAGRKDFWLDDYHDQNPQPQRYAWSWYQWNNVWSWENRNSGLPRLGAGNRNESVYWLDNEAYLRLKNVQLGYNLPKKWLQHIQMDNVRIYLTGENIFTFTKSRDIDPERKKHNTDDIYPLVKSYSLGINIAL